MKRMVENLTGDLLDEIREFLIRANLSTYCINSLLTLSNSGVLTASEISKRAKVPIGRIYEALDELESKKMISVLEGRPKKFKAIPLNKALFNLVSYQREESKKKEKSLFDQLKELEVKYYDISNGIKDERLFYSSVIGTKSIYSLYFQYFKKVQEEILITEFINDTTIKVLNQARFFFEELKKTLKYGVNIKMLWCFEESEKLSKKEKHDLFSQLTEKHQEFGLINEMKGFQIKAIFRRIPTYFDIFDNKRVIFKLQSPSEPRKIFVSLNIFDPNLANHLRTQYNNIWMYEGLD